MPSIPDLLAEYCSLENIELHEDKPTSVQFLPEGKFEHPIYGNLDFSAPVLRQMSRNYGKNVTGTELMVDEDHNHGRALGWVKGLKYGTKKEPMDNKIVGGLFGDVEWTPEGRQMLGNKSYKYFSAEVCSEFTHPQTGETFNNVCLGGGLTNRPYFRMGPVAADNTQFSFHDADGKEIDFNTVVNDQRWVFNEYEPEPATGSFFTPGQVPESKKEVQMDPIAELLRELSFSDANALKDALRAGQSAATLLADLKTKGKAAGIEFGEDVALSIVSAFNILKGERDKLATEKDVLTARVDGIEKKFNDQAFEMKFGDLLKDGKVVPAEKDALHRAFDKDQELFADLVKDRKPVVEFGERGTAGKSEEPGQGDKISGEKAVEEADRYAKMFKEQSGRSN